MVLFYIIDRGVRQSRGCCPPEGVRGCSPRVSALAVIDTSTDPTATDGAESPTTEPTSEIEKVERTDVGVSVRCTLKRGTGTRGLH